MSLYNRCPWEEEEEQSDDEWLFSSVTKYEHLLMFNLSVQPEHIDFSPKGNLIVVGDSQRQELGVYRLPGKLLAQTVESEGLTSNRDFGLEAGTVSAGPLKTLKFLDQEKLVTSRDDFRGLEIWSWGDGDLIKPKLSLDGNQFVPSVLSIDENICSCGGFAKVSKVDVNSDAHWENKSLQEKTEVQSIYSDSGGMLWITQKGGFVSSVDWRSEKISSLFKLGESGENNWEATFLPSNGNLHVLGISLEKGGIISQWDTRNPTRSLNSKSLNLPPSIQCDYNHQVKTCSSGPCIYTFGSKVSVLDPSSLEDIFTHDGHKEKVTSITSHPVVDRLVVSGDKNQGLHAWIYNSSN